MTVTAQTAAAVVGALHLLVGGVGSALWWRVAPDPRWWTALRVAQASAGAFVLLAGGLWLAGWRPSEGLFWLYAGLCVAVNAVGENLKALSAQAILDERGIEDAKAVGRLPEAQQRSVVVAILRRELGVMAVAAIAVAFMASRAYVEA